MSVLTEGQRLDAYRIVRLLGEGGMGAVYEARQEPLERRVALKTLHADHAKSKEFIARDVGRWVGPTLRFGTMVLNLATPAL